MAEKQKKLTYNQVMADLKAGKFAPVYLLMGEEPFYTDRIADYIANNALKEEERDFNQIVFYGLDADVKQVMVSARAVPMMAEHQVIIIKEAQLMKGLDQLEKYLKAPSPSTIFVICYKDEMPKSKKGWIAEAEKSGVVFNTSKIWDSDLPPFITGYLSEYGAKIDSKAVSMIAEHIGTNLERIASELDKVLITLDKKNLVITPEIVEKQIGISKDFNTYELIAAISRKDIVKVNTIMNYIDKNPKALSLHFVIPSLATYFQNLMLAHYCPNKISSENLAAWLGLRGAKAAQNYQYGLRSYSAMKVMQIISKLRSTLAKANGVENRSVTDGKLLQELAFFILH